MPFRESFGKTEGKTICSKVSKLFNKADQLKQIKKF